jgi:hypothetical protein
MGTFTPVMSMSLKGVVVAADPPDARIARTAEIPNAAVTPTNNRARLTFEHLREA